MKTLEKNFISAIVYIRNDEKLVVNFAKKLNEILSNHFLKYEIIFVNDASTDVSVSKLKEVVKNINNSTISIVNMSFYQGKEMSMNAGLDLAIGDFVYMFDNINIDYDMDMIFQIYEKSLEGYDIVNAASDRKGRFTSRVFYKLFNKYSNYEYKLGTSTFQIVSRRAINRIYSISKTVPYRKAIQANCGLKQITLKYESKNNKSLVLDKKMHKDRERTAIDSLILFTDVSYKIAFILSMIMILLTLGVGIYTVYIFLASKPIEGWTTTMLFLSLGFLGMFLLFTIIIKYLSVILNLIFKKTNYLVESIEKIN